jgi:hypothetical protein
MPLGLISTYDLNVGVIVDIDPMIRMLSPSETPLQSGVGSDGNTVLAMNSCFEKKIEWQDDTLLTPQSTLGVALADGVGTTVTVATGEQLRFAVGDVIMVENEKMRITAYGGGADQLTVVRGVFGTTAVAHLINTLVVNLGAALPEGSDPGQTRSQDRVNRFNYTQIFGPTPVVVSGTEQAIRKYGIATTEFDYQAALRLKEEGIKLEQSLLYGTRFEDLTNEWRQMGGMTYYITTNVDTSTTTITDTTLLNQIQACWDRGGNPNRALLGSRQKRNVSAFDSADIRLGRTDGGRGNSVDWFDSDFGRVDMILHRWVRPSDLVLFSREQATIRTLRPFQFKMLGDTGDSVKGMIVGEKTLQFEAERWAARFGALT